MRAPWASMALISSRPLPVLRWRSRSIAWERNEKVSKYRSRHGAPWLVEVVMPELCSAKRRLKSEVWPVYRRPVLSLRRMYMKDIRTWRTGTNPGLPIRRDSLARPERFELPTYCSGGNRSIQLSYGRAPENYTRGAVMAAAGFAAEGTCLSVNGMMAGAPGQRRRWRPRRVIRGWE